MDSNLIHMLVENCCLLLTSKSREVVDSAISFLKILFTVMDNADLAQHVEFLVSKYLINLKKFTYFIFCRVINKRLSIIIRSSE